MRMDIIGRAILCGVALLGLLASIADGLECYQCNVFIRGTPWPCVTDTGMSKKDECISCMKTYTRTYLHNTFHDQLLTSYESRLCVKDKTYSRGDGCYSIQTSSGYMKRCFCHTDLCNAAPSRYDVTYMTSLAAAVVGLVLRVFL